LSARDYSAKPGRQKLRRTCGNGFHQPGSQAQSSHGLGILRLVIGDDGHVQNRISILCDNDEEAVRRAEQLVDGQAIELWQEARRIATIQPKPARPK